MKTLIFTIDNNKKVIRKSNSRLRVERRKRGNAHRASSSSHEAEGDREITFSRNHLRRSAANFARVCMTAFVSRCLYYFIR